MQMINSWHDEALQAVDRSGEALPKAIREAIHGNRGAASDDFLRRHMDDGVQVGGQNVMYISAGDVPPTLPPELAEKRDASGMLQQEARLKFVFPEPTFGHLESLSTEHKGGPQDMAPPPLFIPSADSNTGPTSPAAIMVTTPDGKMGSVSSSSPRPSDNHLANTSPRSSGSSSRASDVSVTPRSSGSFLAGVKRLFVKPPVETKHGIEPLPMSAMTLAVQYNEAQWAQTFRAPERDSTSSARDSASPGFIEPGAPSNRVAAWRDANPEELARRVWANPDPPVPGHLRSHVTAIEGNIGALFNSAGISIGDAAANITSAGAIFNAINGSPGLPDSIRLDLLKKLTAKVVASTLPDEARMNIFTQLKTAVNGITLSGHDQGDLDVLAVLLNLLKDY